MASAARGGWDAADDGGLAADGRLVPRRAVGEVVSALQRALGKIVVGDPRLADVRMGPLASVDQQAEVRQRVDELRAEAELVSGNPDEFTVTGAERTRGAFMPPLLLLCNSPGRAPRPNRLVAITASLLLVMGPRYVGFYPA